MVLRAIATCCTVGPSGCCMLVLPGNMQKKPKHHKLVSGSALRVISDFKTRSGTEVCYMIPYYPTREDRTAPM